MSNRAVTAGKCCLSVCAAVVFACAARASETSERPNVLLIHVDQHRIDCLGAYGNPDVKTPHIDRLAGDGKRYP